MLYYFAIGLAISIWVTSGVVKAQKKEIRKQKESEKGYYAIAAVLISLIFWLLALLLWPLFIVAKVIGKSLGKEVQHEQSK